MRQYMLRKLVEAENALDAIKKDRRTPVYDVLIVEEEQQAAPTNAIGFQMPVKDDND